MSPFVVIPSLMIFLNMGIDKFGGRINFILSLILFFLVVFLPVLSFCIKEIKIDQYTSLMKKKEKKGGEVQKCWRNLVKFNKAENRESLWIYVETLAISSSICFQNKLAFFIVVTPLILWKAVHASAEIGNSCPSSNYSSDSKV